MFAIFRSAIRIWRVWKSGSETFECFKVDFSGKRGSLEFSRILKLGFVRKTRIRSGSRADFRLQNWSRISVSDGSLAFDPKLRCIYAKAKARDAY